MAGDGVVKVVGLCQRALVFFIGAGDEKVKVFWVIRVGGDYGVTRVTFPLVKDRGDSRGRLFYSAHLAVHLYPPVLKAEKGLYSQNVSKSPFRFGKTAAAVKAFQTDHGLQADGVCGPMTWAALETAAAGKRYTIRIEHLTEYQKEALRQLYPDAEITEEGSVG